MAATSDQPDPALAERAVTAGLSAAVRRTAAQHADREAVREDGQGVSYVQLSLDADRLAWRLNELATAPHQHVAIRVVGAHAMTVAFLGAIRAGMVLVPVDPAAPKERATTICRDAEATLAVDDTGADLGGLPTVHPLRPGTGRDEPIDLDQGELASIRFTSGSTGAPKGIMTPPSEQGWLAQFILETVQAQGQQVSARDGIFNPGSTGPGLAMIGLPLLTGGTMVSYPIRRLGLGPLAEWLLTERIERFVLVPTVLRALLPSLTPDLRFPALRHVLLYGEASTWEDVMALRRHLAADAVVENAFGLTEASAISSLAISADTPAGAGALPLGRPRAGVRVRIVGPDGQPVEPGELGELVVSSPGCGVGYWGRPDLSRGVFSQTGDGVPEVWTGDRARLAADGTLEHFGRLDHVVKISGNRVELGEVEHNLRTLSGVAGAAVTTYQDPHGATRLTAYVVPESDTPVRTDLLRSELARTLPGYALPDGIDLIEALPLLPNGKLDRQGLPERHWSDRGTRGARHRSVLEAQLAAIWCEVLGVTNVGSDDDFFALGGDSMRAVRSFVLLSERHGIDRPPSMLVEAPTLASLALAIERDDAPWDSLLAIQVSGSRPPLFVVHDGLGNVTHARGLVAGLGPDQPIYGIKAAALTGEPVAERSLEELAARYVGQIRSLYPSGPYLLYGVSLGGVIAYEMATQLEAAGDRVALLVLGDSTAPAGVTPPDLMPPTLPERVRTRARELRGRPLRDAAGHLIQIGRESNVLRNLARGHLSTARTETERRQKWVIKQVEKGRRVPFEMRDQYVLVALGRLAAAYTPTRRLGVDCLLVRAMDYEDLPRPRDHGWSAHLVQPPVIRDVELEHNDLAREANGHLVSAVICDVLEQVATVA